MHKAARLAFAHKFVHWTTEDWYKVIWIDESSFQLGKTLDKIEFGAEFHENYAKIV